MMMKTLQDVLCDSAKCESQWAPDIMNNCGTSCTVPSALGLIHKYSSCQGEGTSCGWSLDLFRDDSLGKKMWGQIAAVISEQPMTVIFLTRNDSVAQHVSSSVAQERRKIMEAVDFKKNFGDVPCTAWQFHECPADVARWVDNKSNFTLNLKAMHDEVLMYERALKTYAGLEDMLRARKEANLKVLHVAYEDLQDSATWKKIFKAVGKPDAPIPKMFQSNYSSFFTNWKDVEFYSGRRHQM